jgi:hypothetical protein
MYREEPGKALHALTTAFQGAMEREVVHVERIDMAALARAVEAGLPLFAYGAAANFLPYYLPGWHW